LLSCTHDYLIIDIYIMMSYNCLCCFPMFHKLHPLLYPKGDNASKDEER
jgi:hypothetical protein